jgi:hypothetical protein
VLKVSVLGEGSPTSQQASHKEYCEDDCLAKRLRVPENRFEFLQRIGEHEVYSHSFSVGF